MQALLPLIAIVVLTLTPLAHCATTAPTVKAEDLPRVPATEVRDAIKNFKVHPGFQLQIAAAEPNVADPIAMCFDESGRMFEVRLRGSRFELAFGHFGVLDRV